MFSHRNFSLYGGHRDEINCLVVLFDLEILITGSLTGCIRLWNTVYDHLTFKIQEQTGRIRGLTLSNNDKYFASIANRIDIYLYQTRTGNLIRSLSGHTSVSDCLQFSFDNQFLASGSWDCRTIVWNVETGEQMYDFHHHTDAIQSIAFHPTKNLMVTGSYDRTVFLYNLEEVSSMKPVELHGHFNNIHALAFSLLPYLASAGRDKIIIIWQIETKRIHSRLFGHAGWIQAISFSHYDGSILASIDDETVRVWNIVTNRCLYQLSVVNDFSCCIRFLPGNKSLIVGGTVYELLLDDQITSEERIRAKHINEETVSIPLKRKKKKTLTI